MKLAPCTKCPSQYAPVACRRATNFPSQQAICFAEHLALACIVRDILGLNFEESLSMCVLVKEKNGIKHLLAIAIVNRVSLIIS